MDTHPAADVPADTIAPERYRLAQRAELEVRFREAMGRGASDQTELLAWVAGARIQGPVVPRASLLERHLD